jgi:GNAT superfamily N-acetyltransferase
MELTFDIYPVTGKKIWPYFAEHHYLSENYVGHRAWIAVVDDVPVGFSSIIRFPSGSVKNAWREHRTVIIPQFQGLGLGARLSDWTAHYVCATLTEGEGRYFSKTVHPRLGEYREHSPLWKPTSKNKIARTEKEAGAVYKGYSLTNRSSYSHEYIGAQNDKDIP